MPSAYKNFSLLWTYLQQIARYKYQYLLLMKFNIIGSYIILNIPKYNWTDMRKLGKLYKIRTIS